VGDPYRVSSIQSILGQVPISEDDLREGKHSLTPSKHKYAKRIPDSKRDEKSTREA